MSGHHARGRAASCEIACRKAIEDIERLLPWIHIESIGPGNFRHEIPARDPLLTMKDCRKGEPFAWRWEFTRAAEIRCLGVPRRSMRTSFS